MCRRNATNRDEKQLIAYGRQGFGGPRAGDNDQYGLPHCLARWVGIVCIRLCVHVTHALDAGTATRNTHAMARSRAEEKHHSGELSNKRRRREEGRENSSGVKRHREDDDTECVPQSSRDPLVPRDNTRKRTITPRALLSLGGSKAKVNDSSGALLSPGLGGEARQVLRGPSCPSG